MTRVAPLRLGLAGLGIHGLRYAKHLLAGEVEGAVLAAVSRSDARAGTAFAEEHGVVFVPDPRALATTAGVDAVVLVLPPDRNLEPAVASLEAGRPLLVEKPLAHDLASARTIADAGDRTGVPLMVAHTQRFDPLVLRLRREIPSIAPVRLVSIHQRFEPAPRPWGDDPRRGGAIRITGVHGFDMLRFLTGAEVLDLDARTGRVLTERAEDQFVATARLAPGEILATIDNSFASGGRSSRIEVVGERGQLHAELIHRTLTRIVGHESEELGPVPETPTIVATLRAFARAVAEKVPVPISAEDGVRAVECLERALRRRT